MGQDGVILEYNGVLWVLNEQLPSFNSIFGVSLTSETDGFAVGGNGLILRVQANPAVESATLGNIRALYK